MAAPQRRWAAEILYVWFHQLRPRDWFRSTAAIDAMLARRFGPDLAMLSGEPAHSFLSDPKTALAAVLLFDQVPRNTRRGSAASYATDPLARAITHGAIARGWDEALPFRGRQFLYMPLMHSEDIMDQRLSLACFARIPRRYGLAFAVPHHHAVARFGRFPHRNPLLGRTSTPAEERAVAAGLRW